MITTTETAVKERPILFSTEMVNAILSGQKTQTRREVNFGRYAPWVPELQPDKWQVKGFDVYNGKGELHGTLKQVYGKIGDVLWVRETWAKTPDFGYCYKASQTPEGEAARQDYLKAGADWAKWKPSIHMPREACRLRLEITNIRVERLLSISCEDAKAEGVKRYGNGGYKFYMNPEPRHVTPAVDVPQTSFFTLWETINGKESLLANPWVWVVEFKRLDA